MDYETVEVVSSHQRNGISFPFVSEMKGNAVDVNFSFSSGTYDRKHSHKCESWPSGRFLYAHHQGIHTNSRPLIHSLQAMEPFFSVILSSLFLGEKPTLWITLSLLPIVGGVAVASISEVTFIFGFFE